MKHVARLAAIVALVAVGTSANCLTQDSAIPPDGAPDVRVGSRIALLGTNLPEGVFFVEEVRGPWVRLGTEAEAMGTDRESSDHLATHWINLAAVPGYELLPTTADTDLVTSLRGTWIGEFYQYDINKRYPMELRMDPMDGATFGVKSTWRSLNSRTNGRGKVVGGELLWSEREIVEGNVVLDGRYTARIYGGDRLIGRYVRDDTSGEVGIFQLRRLPLRRLPIGSATLLARGRYSDYEKSTFSFEHGLRDDPGLSVTHNDWDVEFGNGGDYFDVIIVTDDRSRIVDLGPMSWEEVDDGAVLELHRSRETQSRPSVRGSPESRAQVIDGHVYLVHTKDSESDYMALVRVEQLVPRDHVDISWRLLHR